MKGTPDWANLSKIRRKELTIIERHILWRLLRAFLFLVVILVTFFILLHYMEYVDDFLDRKAPMQEIYFVYYPSYVPEIVRLISPLALFLACIYVTGKLAQTMQLTALQTSGVSIYRLLIPYTVLAIAMTGMMVWFNGWVVPVTNQVVLQFDSLYLKEAPRRIDTSDIHRQNSPGSVLSVGYYDRATDTAHRVVLQLFDDSGRLVKRVDCEKMVWRDSLWQMPNATIRTFRGAVESRQQLVDHDTLLQVLPRDLARTERDVESMTIPVARDYVQALRRSGAGSIGRPEVGYYTKYSYPLANLVVVFLAIPLAVRRRRGGQALQIGFGLLLAFVYLAAQKLLEPFGYSGEIGPRITAFAPHLLFFLVSAALLVRTKR